MGQKICPAWGCYPYFYPLGQSGAFGDADIFNVGQSMASLVLLRYFIN
jgi:hypothetical protein